MVRKLLRSEIATRESAEPLQSGRSRMVFGDSLNHLCKDETPHGVAG
jgi:hypothetical protein